MSKPTQLKKKDSVTGIRGIGLGRPTYYIDFNTVEGLFQDEAGTIPVTKDGDVVRLIMDQSGNGNHKIANGVVYRHDGKGGCLETDLDDDANRGY